MSQASHGPTPQPVVFWIIWFAILSGLFFMQMLVPRGADSSSGDGSLIFQVIGLGSAAASLIVRFAVIPKLKELQQKLPAMIIGLALAEGVGIIGIFVVSHQDDATRLFLLGVSIVCIVISAPIYAKLPSGGSPFRN